MKSQAVLQSLVCNRPFSNIRPPNRLLNFVLAPISRKTLKKRIKQRFAFVRPNQIQFTCLKNALVYELLGYKAAQSFAKFCISPEVLVFLIITNQKL